MTHEEAIKQLNSIAIYHFDKYTANAIDMAIESLEKQIPKKPTMGKYGHTECACCGWVVETFCGDLEQYPFCPNCGQAIDWRDAE